MITRIQKKFALSRQGAVDLIKGCIACMLQNLSLMLPVGLLYWLVSNLLNQTVIDSDRANQSPYDVSEETRNEIRTIKNRLLEIEKENKNNK